MNNKPDFNDLIKQWSHESAEDLADMYGDIKGDFDRMRRDLDDQAYQNRIDRMNEQLEGQEIVNKLNNDNE